MKKSILIVLLTITNVVLIMFIICDNTATDSNNVQNAQTELLHQTFRNGYMIGAKDEIYGMVKIGSSEGRWLDFSNELNNIK